jgi:hypothetical protein
MDRRGRSRCQRKESPMTRMTRFALHAARIVPIALAFGYVVYH